MSIIMLLCYVFLRITYHFVILITTTTLVSSKCQLITLVFLDLVTWSKFAALVNTVEFQNPFTSNLIIHLKLLDIRGMTKEQFGPLLLKKKEREFFSLEFVTSCEDPNMLYDPKAFKVLGSMELMNTLY